MVHKRRDAVEVTGMDGLHALFPYVMPKRTEAECALHTEVDITGLMEWIKNKNENEGTQYKLFHAVCAAVGKTICQRPLLNRFIAGKRYWQRNEITLSFVAKRQFADGAQESLMTFKLKEDQNLDDLSRFIIGDVNKMRSSGSHGLDDTIDAFGRLPRWLLNIVFFVLARLEYHGIIIPALTEGDSNYTTVLLSNLGSIGGGAPYHHLNNYGTNSLMMTIGTYFKRKNEDGETRLILPMSIMLDERIADGYYFTRSVKYLNWLLENPDELLKPFSELGDYEF
ncbi:MAG: hypothetical protein K5911_01225 [Eubacteriales bacterium]|nr:hypothetical protein [Eubacteriales bacterium]